MKKFLLNEYFLFLLICLIIIYITIFQSGLQDYTSIIDFDLTVIHNSLQLVSREFPDFQDLTAYSHFLTYGIFYKIFGFFDDSLITNINLLVENENPEISLQKLYIISRIVNSTLHLITLLFIYKIMGIFNVDKYYKILSICFIILSETFIANFIILRTDIIAVCYFIISSYFLLKFVKTQNILELFYVSLFLVLSLLAKVQIIFLFMFIFLFFIFYILNEENEYNLKSKYNLVMFKIFKFKYLLIIFLILYSFFQIYLNLFVDSSTGVGYFDLICFNFYFLLMFFCTLYICKIKNISQEYLYNIFSLIILFAILNVFILKVLDFFNLIRFDFRIIFSLTNPFYFLKIYSPFNENPMSISLIYEMVLTLFEKFKFNKIYLFLTIIVLLGNLFKSIIFKNIKLYEKNKIYIYLLILNVLFLTALNNFRYNISYNIYMLPFFILFLAIFINSLVKKYKIIFSFLFIILISSNFIVNIDNYKNYILKESNHKYVCTNRDIRNFYYHWARNFNENFFEKICVNKNLSFK